MNFLGWSTNHKLNTDAYPTGGLTQSGNSSIITTQPWWYLWATLTLLIMQTISAAVGRQNPPEDLSNESCWVNRQVSFLRLRRSAFAGAPPEDMMLGAGGGKKGWGSDRYRTPIPTGTLLFPSYAQGHGNECPRMASSQHKHLPEQHLGLIIIQLLYQSSSVLLGWQNSCSVSVLHCIE